MLYSKKICRFCLESAKTCIIIDNNVREIIGSLCTVNFFSKDLHISVFKTDQEHAICNFCIAYLEKAEKLIRTSKESMITFSEALDCLPCKIIKLDWLPIFKNISKNHTVCCICFHIVNNSAVVFLYKNCSVNVLPHNFIRKMLSYTTIVLSRRIMDPVMCLECWILVQEVYTFKKTYDEVESRIDLFYENNVKTHITTNDLCKIVYGDCYSEKEISQSLVHFPDEAPSNSATLSALEDSENHIVNDALENGMENVALNLQIGFQPKEKVECWLSSIQDDLNSENVNDKNTQIAEGNKTDCIKKKPNVKKKSIVKKKHNIKKKPSINKPTEIKDVYGLQIYLEHDFKDLIKILSKKRKPRDYQWNFKKPEISQQFRRKSPFSCIYCNFTTISDYAVYHHMCGHKEGRLVLHHCELCDYKVPNKFTFANHMKTHEPSLSQSELTKPTEPDKDQIAQESNLSTTITSSTIDTENVTADDSALKFKEIAQESNLSTTITSSTIDTENVTADDSALKFKEIEPLGNFKETEGTILKMTTRLDTHVSTQEHNNTTEEQHLNNDSDSDVTNLDSVDHVNSKHNILLTEPFTIVDEDESSRDFLSEYMTTENYRLTNESNGNNLDGSALDIHQHITERKEVPFEKSDDSSCFSNDRIEQHVAEENETTQDVSSPHQNTKEHQDIPVANLTERKEGMLELVAKKMVKRKYFKRKKTEVVGQDSDTSDMPTVSTSKMQKITANNVIQTRSRSKLGNPKTVYQCNLCEKTFMSNLLFKKHAEKHDSDAKKINKPQKDLEKQQMISNNISENSSAIATENERLKLNDLNEKSDMKQCSDYEDSYSSDYNNYEINMSPSEDEASADFPSQSAKCTSVDNHCTLQTDINATPKFVGNEQEHIDKVEINIDKVDIYINEIEATAENAVNSTTDGDGSNVLESNAREDPCDDIYDVDSGDGLMENSIPNNETGDSHSSTDDDVIFFERPPQPAIIYQKQTFKCDVCDFSSCSSEQIQLHSEGHKENILQVFRCTQCPYKISIYSLLQEHLKTHPPLEIIESDCSIGDSDDEIRCHNDTTRSEGKGRNSVDLLEINDESVEDEDDHKDRLKRISDNIMEEVNDMVEIDIEKSNVVDIIKEHWELLDIPDEYNPSFRKPLIPCLRINDTNVSSSEFNQDETMEFSAGNIISAIIDNLIQDDSQTASDPIGENKLSQLIGDEQETRLLNEIEGVETAFLTEDQEQALLRDENDEKPPELLDLKSEEKCRIVKDEPPFLEQQTTPNDMVCQIQSVWSVSNNVSYNCCEFEMQVANSEPTNEQDMQMDINPMQGTSSNQVPSGCSNSCTDYSHYCQLVNSIVFLCAFCNTAFSTDAEKRIHQQFVHTSIRYRYKCFFCSDKVFARKEYICHMMEKHNGLKYKCSICEEIFIGAGFIEQHVLGHRGFKTTFCKFCVKNNFKVGNAIFPCFKCGRNFSSYHILLQHSKIHSSIGIKEILFSQKEDNADYLHLVLKPPASNETSTHKGDSEVRVHETQTVSDQSKLVSVELEKSNIESCCDYLLTGKRMLVNYKNLKPLT